MSRECPCCKRRNRRRSCSAPPCTPFTIPTLYDHCDEFHKTKEDEKLVKNCKKHFFNKFIDRCEHSPDVNPEKDMFCTQECLSFLHNIRPQSEEQSLTDGFYSIDAKKLRKKTSPMAISYSPVNCPITQCGRLYAVTTLMSHFLTDHKADLSMQCKEICKGMRVVLIFNPSTLPKRQNCCLGVLAYGGCANDPASRPAVRGIGVHNIYLPEKLRKLDKHLCIMIMACRTDWAAMLKNKELETTITQEENPNHKLLLVWLSSVQTKRHIHGTITAFDKAMTASISSVIQVRSLSHSQDPGDFMPEDQNQLRLSRCDLDKLSQNGKECIYLEIKINEYDE